MFHAIRSDLVLVDRGVKPGFLYDYSRISADEVTRLLQDLYQAKLLHSELIVLVIDEFDIVIVNRPVTLQYLVTLQPGDNVTVVDVSDTLQSPQCLDLGNSIWETTVTFLKQHIQKAEPFCMTHITPDPELNCTTMFGILLGYPVIYWYSTQSHSNCLGMVPLTLCQLSVLLTHDAETRRHCAYSFTYPADLTQTVFGSVHRWLTHRQQVTAEVSEVTDTVFDTSHTCQPVVAL